MKNITVSFWEQLSMQIILLFSIAIMATFIPEHWHQFFGDELCKGSTYVPALWSMDGHVTKESYYVGCTLGGSHLPTWHWGWRHWLWCFMSILLFLCSSVRIVIFIKKNFKK